MSDPQVMRTDGIGYEMRKRFGITGRARGSESRGCSIAIDELLSAQTT